MFGNIVLVGLIPAVMAKPILSRDELASRNMTDMAASMNRSNIAAMGDAMAAMLRRESKPDAEPRDLAQMATHKGNGTATSTAMATPSEFASILHMAGRQIDPNLPNIPTVTSVPSDILSATSMLSVSTTADLSALSTGILEMPMDKRQVLPSAALTASLKPSLSTKLPLPKTSSLGCECGSFCADETATADIIICVQECLERCPKGSSSKTGSKASPTPDPDPEPEYQRRQLDPIPFSEPPIPMRTLPVNPSSLIPPSVPLPSLPSVSYTPMVSSLTEPLPFSEPPIPMRTLSFVPRAASSATPYVPDEATKKKCSTRCDDICKSSDSSCKGHCVEICNNDPKQAVTSTTPTPTPTPDPVKECPKKCDDICKGFESSCNGNCVDICLSDAARRAAAAAPVKKDLIPSLGGTSKSDGPAIAAGSADYQSCLSDCYHNGQDADIAFHVSQHDGSCEEQCTALSASSATILVKKQVLKGLRLGRDSAEVPADDDTAGNEIPVSAPLSSGPAIGAGSVDYDSCMRDCNQNCQSADIGFPVTQCDGSCKDKCTALSASGAGSILVKKQVLGGLGLGGDNGEVPADDDTAGNEIPVSAPQSGPAIGAGSVDYDSCMRDCNQNCQTADIGFPVTQCDGSCKEKCEALSGSGAAVLGKRQAVPVPTLLPSTRLPIPSLSTRLPLSVPTSTRISLLPTITSAASAVPSALAPCECGLQCANADDIAATLICVEACLAECPSLPKETGPVSIKSL